MRTIENYLQWSFLALTCLLVAIGMLSASSMVWDIQRFFVDFLLAGIIGVGFYPLFGNRIWCRFFCPLSRVLHVSAGNLSDVKISCGTHCIECGLCSKYCQMGIPVMEFAKNSQAFDNKNSSCIQCGLCISVCPVRNLQNGEWNEIEWEANSHKGPLTPLE
jgi:polyferredoxin